MATAEHARAGKLLQDLQRSAALLRTANTSAITDQRERARHDDIELRFLKAASARNLHLPRRDRILLQEKHKLQHRRVAGTLQALDQIRP